MAEEGPGKNRESSKIDSERGQSGNRFGLITYSQRKIPLLIVCVTLCVCVLSNTRKRPMPEVLTLQQP